jgi:uncharacterized protein (DUF58 family)
VPQPLFDAAFLKQLEMLTLMAKQLFRGDSRGERRSKVHGASVEFADFRPYVQGDDFRRIDWNAYAKFENLILRLFVEEQELTVHLLLDCSTSMDFGDPHKFDYARRLAAALAYMALANTDRVTFTTLAVDEESHSVIGPAQRALRGKTGFAGLLERLQTLKPIGQTDLNASLQRFALRTARPGLVIVISDFLSEAGISEGFKRLRYAQNDIVLLQVLAPQEISPELGGDVRLVDSETRAAVDVSANRRVLAAYSRRLATFVDEISSFARTHGGAHALVNTSAPIEQIVLRDLRALGLTR